MLALVSWINVFPIIELVLDIFVTQVFSSLVCHYFTYDSSKGLPFLFTFTRVMMEEVVVWLEVGEDLNLCFGEN